ncbi:MAG: hypothetical protein QOI10_1173 [Solirubrobacterales bacterium]|nr:hypothetical protein [Solirubrobacterales bacterium]
MTPESVARDASFEPELDRILVGDRTPGPVSLTEYDPGWPRRFESLRAELGDQARAIEHIGSTAVPGLIAKPIVDILVTVEKVDPDTTYAPTIEGLGYELRVREPRHRMFRNPARDVHLHVWPEGSREAVDYLLLRDWLRSSEVDRDEYARLKQELAREDWPDINYYARAKGPLIEELLSRARSER